MRPAMTSPPSEATVATQPTTPAGDLDPLEQHLLERLRALAPGADGARAAADRPGAAALPVGRVLPRARGAGWTRRRARHPARRDRGARRADRGRTPQGVREPRARGDPPDVHDRVAPAALGRDRVRD